MDTVFLIIPTITLLWIFMGYHAHLINKLRRDVSSLKDKLEQMEYEFYTLDKLNRNSERRG